VIFKMIRERKSYYFSPTIWKCYNVRVYFVIVVAVKSNKQSINSQDKEAGYTQCHSSGVRRGRHFNYYFYWYERSVWPTIFLQFCEKTCIRTSFSKPLGIIFGEINFRIMIEEMLIQCMGRMVLRNIDFIAIEKCVKP